MCVCVCPLEQLTERRTALLASAASRKVKLNDCTKLQQFLHDSDDILSWIGEMMKVAQDDSYKVAMIIDFGNVVRLTVICNN